MAAYPPVAALQQRRQLLADQPTTGFECTIAVNDVHQVEKVAVDAGGRLLIQTTTIAGVGHLIWLADPSGNVVGAMQYDKQRRITTPPSAAPRMRRSAGFT